MRSQLGLNEKDKRFPRKGTIMEMISKSENTLRSLDEIILEEFSHFADHSEDLGRLQKAYEAAKRQKQLLDYDDLLVMLRQLLLFDENGAHEHITSVSLHPRGRVSRYESAAGGGHPSTGSDSSECDGGG